MFKLNSFHLKIIAIVAMTLNHIANTIGDRLPHSIEFIFYGFGGLTFPIMAFLLVEGYNKTSNVKKYLARLFIFALISHYPYIHALFSQYNILFTLLLGLFSLFIYDKVRNKFLFTILFLIIIVIADGCDWGFTGVILIFAMGMVNEDKNKKMAMITIMATIGITKNILFIPNIIALKQILYHVSCLGAIPLLYSYNNERGLNMKYFFYIYYPLHLLILAAI